jgi:hypothetical protein
MHLIFLNLLLLVLLLFCQCNSYSVKKKPKLDANDNSIHHPLISNCGLERFTQSEDEHIINQIQQPFRVRKIKGRITSETGDWPEGIQILISIRSIDRYSKVIKSFADKNGFFEIENLKKGKYCFKVTVNGWQSVVGTVIFTKDVDPNYEINVQMQLGV